MNHEISEDMMSNTFRSQAANTTDLLHTPVCNHSRKCFILTEFVVYKSSFRGFVNLNLFSVQQIEYLRKQQSW